MEGLENKFCDDWQDWGEFGNGGLQFSDCSWTQYTKDLLGEYYTQFDTIAIDSETSKIEFYHKESSSYNRVFKVELVVVEEEK